MVIVNLGREMWKMLISDTSKSNPASSNQWHLPKYSDLVILVWNSCYDLVSQTIRSTQYSRSTLSNVFYFFLFMAWQSLSISFSLFLTFLANRKLAKRTEKWSMKAFFFSLFGPLSQVSVTVEVRGKAGTYLKQTISLGQLDKVGLISILLSSIPSFK